MPRSRPHRPTRRETCSALYSLGQFPDAKLRRAIVARDVRCQFPGCDFPGNRCEVHHLRHRSSGGETTPENLALFCDRHHHLLHRFGWKAYRGDDGIDRRPRPARRSGRPAAPVGRALSGHILSRAAGWPTLAFLTDRQIRYRVGHDHRRGHHHQGVSTTLDGARTPRRPSAVPDETPFPRGDPGLDGGEPHRGLRAAARPRRPRRRALVRRGAHGVGARPGRRRLDLRRLAHRARRPRPPARPEVIFHEEYARAGGPGRAGLVGEGLLGPTIIHFASPEQQQRFLPGHRVRHRVLVPGLLRAERRFRPRQREDQRPPRRRRVGHQRPEGVDVAGAVVRLVLRRRPHRGRQRAPPRPVLPAHADGPAGHRDPADPPDHRHRRVQRGLLRRSPHRRSTCSSASRATAGRSPWARSPSSAAP